MSILTNLPSQWLTLAAVSIIPILLIYLLIGGKKKNKSSPAVLNPPPGPPQLPVIGNLHQLDATSLYNSFHVMSQQYGHVMSLQLGHAPTVVISSSDGARQLMKDNDLDTCSRPLGAGAKKLSYNYLDVAFSPYSDYWREMRKLFIFELLSMKRVHAFSYARDQHVDKMVERVKEAAARGEPVNLSKLVFNVADGIIGTTTLYEQDEFEGGFVKVMEEAMDMLNGFHAEDFLPIAGKVVDWLTGATRRWEKTFRKLDDFFEKIIALHLDPNRKKSKNEDVVDVLIGLMKDQSASFQITNDHLKAILMNIFIGAIDTSAVTVGWAFSELLRNPRIMSKAQSEIRSLIGPNQNRAETQHVDKFNYLELIIRETFRKHPPVPLLVPHFCQKQCKIGGYDILPGTQIIVNAYSLGRDPNTWADPESFYPERFQGSDVDYKGSHFELIPFGAGRRICPGLAMGTTAVKSMLANLLYHFDYELPGGMRLEDFPMEAAGGLTIHNKHDVVVVAKKQFGYGSKSLFSQIHLRGRSNGCDGPSIFRLIQWLRLIQG
ncbi:2-methylbutanal oxime monooxygenase [Linum perenne]